MVTPLPPVKAVKNEHKTVAAKTVPLTPVPNMAMKTWPKRLADPVDAKTKPARVNKGNAGNEALTVIW